MAIPEPDVMYASQIGVDALELDEDALPDDIRIALEVERRILEYHHTGIEREKSLAHLCHLRIDVLNERINNLGQEEE